MWLKTEDLEEILEQCDLTPEIALLILWQHGHIALPPWLEDILLPLNGDEYIEG
jgi:hypothetical protein